MNVLSHPGQREPHYAGLPLVLTQNFRLLTPEASPVLNQLAGPPENLEKRSTFRSNSTSRCLIGREEEEGGANRCNVQRRCREEQPSWAAHSNHRGPLHKPKPPRPRSSVSPASWASGEAHNARRKRPCVGSVTTSGHHNRGGSAEAPPPPPPVTSSVSPVSPEQQPEPQHRSCRARLTQDLPKRSLSHGRKRRLGKPPHQKL